MPVLSWTCAHGEAPPVELAVASTVAISPPDDSVDTNSIIITGEGTINSFGVCLYPIVKRVCFIPVAPALQPGEPRVPSPQIVLVNSAALNLLGKNNRTITAQSYAEYSCGGDDIWTETYFSATGTALTEVRVSELEQRISDLERRLSELSPKATGD